jgi:hypothetical protein
MLAQPVRPVFKVLPVVTELLVRKDPLERRETTVRPELRVFKGRPGIMVLPGLRVQPGFRVTMELLAHQEYKAMLVRKVLREATAPQVHRGQQARKVTMAAPDQMAYKG